MIDEKNNDKIDIISNNDIFDASAEAIVSLNERFVSFTTVIYLFYKMKLSDINIDIFD
jgi:hypothetical protein